MRGAASSRLPVKTLNRPPLGAASGQHGGTGWTIGRLFHELQAAVIAVGCAALLMLIGVEGDLWL